MQIGSALFHSALLPSSLAARTPSSDLSSPSSSTQPAGAATSLSDTDEQKASRDEPQGPQAADEPSPAREAAQQRQVELELAELASRDREVRAHEQAHAAVGGSYAGAPTYTFKNGPDGKRYAVGGEVSIDTSAVASDPEATLRKMEVVIRAALAPAEPSAQDRRVAAQATAQAAQARAELAQQQREEALADAEARAAQRAEQQAEEEAKTDSAEEPAAQAVAPPPRLDLYLRLAQLQSPESTVDLSV